MKQFLLVVDDAGREALAKVMPRIRFLEVEGTTLQGVDGVQFVVNPLPKQQPETPLMEPDGQVAD